MVNVEEYQDNHPDIEKQWAVKAFHHAEVYMNLMARVQDPSKLNLSKMDNEIYADFRSTFPELKVDVLNESADFKNESMKAKWREFIMKYEQTVQDYNFGTLLRINCNRDYDQDNTMFGRGTRARECYAASILLNNTYTTSYPAPILRYRDC